MKHISDPPPCRSWAKLAARIMPWKSIRLELASTDGFPSGSASRCYLLRLPLDEKARIDASAVSHTPALATVYRYWPNEADRFGRIIQAADRWAVQFEADEAAAVLDLETRPFIEGNIIDVVDLNGARRPFRVVSVRPLA